MRRRAEYSSGATLEQRTSGQPSEPNSQPWMLVVVPEDLKDRVVVALEGIGYTHRDYHAVDRPAEAKSIAANYPIVITNLDFMTRIAKEGATILVEENVELSKQYLDVDSDYFKDRLRERIERILEKQGVLCHYPTQETSPEQQKATILLADDNPGLYKGALTNAGNIVVTKTDLVEAGFAVAHGGIDVLVSSQRFKCHKRSTGSQLAKYVRQNHPEIGVIIQAEDITDKLRQEAERYGYRVIERSADPKVLLNVVAQALTPEAATGPFSSGTVKSIAQGNRTRTRRLRRGNYMSISATWKQD